MTYQKGCHRVALLYEVKNVNMNSTEQIIKPRSKFPTITQAWYITLIFFAVTIAVSGILALLIKDSKDLTLFLGYTIPFVIIVVMAFLFQKHDFEAKFTTLFRKFDIQIVPFLLLFVLGFGYASDYVTSLIPIPDFMRTLFSQMFSFSIWGFALVCIAAPLLEEVLCRGIFLRSFLENYSGKKAILWSAIIFAAIHMNPWQAIPAFIIGYFMGWLFYRTKSLLPSIVVHFINNIVAYVAAGMLGDDFENGKMLSWQLNLALAVVGALIALFSVYRIRKILGKEVVQQ
ncbi:type II CAAX endopeptidase family protein [uncultured Acetobacteroides sp.]|uniref:CPBP family intramembrane glutamic endopeptidase n=1 Tax=uncultured Acetobacteroides sp. TaxID=1760811 RepID=UPI0029F4C09D|nr:type II CAAX endopeptidase family protein [uncultured Acetobacteroides sp.]